jgi:hypothetical protein
MARRPFLHLLSQQCHVPPSDVHLSWHSKQPEHWAPKTPGDLDSLGSLPLLHFFRSCDELHIDLPERRRS